MESASGPALSACGAGRPHSPRFPMEAPCEEAVRELTMGGGGGVTYEPLYGTRRSYVTGDGEATAAERVPRLLRMRRPLPPLRRAAATTACRVSSGGRALD